MVTKLKKLNCDKTQKLKWRQNSKYENSNCNNSKTQDVTTSKILIVTKLKNSNCDQTQKLKM